MKNGLIIILVLFSAFWATSFDASSEKSTIFISDNVEENSEEIVFRIQIAASKRKLSASELQKIWKEFVPGETQIYEDKEGEWIKYLVGDFESYEDACLAEENMTVKDSFIVAYRNGWERVQNIEDVCNPYEHPCYNRNK